MTFTPKKDSRASLVARVGTLLSVRKCEYLPSMLLKSLNVSFWIADDGRILAFFFGLIGWHLGG